MNGTALPIDELKAMESIDLSQKRLSIASVIVASCIKENRALKQLKCAVSLEHPHASASVYSSGCCVVAVCNTQSSMITVELFLPRV